VGYPVQLNVCGAHTVTCYRSVAGFFMSKKQAYKRNASQLREFESQPAGYKG